MDNSFLDAGTVVNMDYFLARQGRPRRVQILIANGAHSKLTNA